MNRSGLTISAAAAMLLGLPAAAVAHAATAHTIDQSTVSRPAAPRVGPGMTENVSLSASMVLRVRGMQQRVSLTGSGTMTLGSPMVVAGRPAIPFLVNVGPLTGNNSVLGRVQVTTDGPQDAWLMENSQASPFPAEEVLPVNDHVSISVLPGQSFVVKDANSGPAILHSSNITSFPPQNTVYQLAGPAQLEDANHPGQALATVQTLQITVKPAGMMPPGQNR